ncbi:MAG: DUF4012 domain-containing protein [Aeromicrobium sp.]
MLARDAVTTRSALKQAASQAEALQGEIVAGDGAGAAKTLAALRESADTARASTDGILWDLGSHLPLLGSNISSAQTVAEVLDTVSDEALPPIVDVSSRLSLEAFSPRGGRFDLERVEAVAPAVATADAVLTQARADLDGIDAGSLLLPLKTPVRRIQSKVDSAQSVARAGATAARLMPAMMGRDGTRRYLLLIQNNAEARATGGIAGSYAVITAKRGKLTMGRQGSSVDFAPIDDPVVPMSRDEQTVFTDQLVTDVRDANVTPDFPRSGEIARAMAKEALGVDVDGVLSVDPVAMSHLLAGTGPVDLGQDVVLDQGNAVESLLSTIYLRLDPALQDGFFEITARAIFDAVTSGAGQSLPVIAGLVRAAEENRLMLWSARTGEQEQIAATGLAGAFAGDTGGTPHVGVYVGDSAGGKMQYYLDATTVARATRCLDEDTQEIVISTQLTSSAPRGLPASVTGLDEELPDGEMRFFAWLYAPYGGRFTSITLDGKPQIITTARLDGRSETSVPVSLPPGATRTLTARMLTGPGQGADGVISTTPGVRTAANDRPIASACE